MNFKLFNNTTHSISLFIFRLATKNRNGPGRAGPGRAHNGPGRAGLKKIHGKTGRAGPQLGRAGPGRAYKIRPVQTSSRVYLIAYWHPYSILNNLAKEYILYLLKKIKFTGFSKSVINKSEIISFSGSASSMIW